MRVLVDAREVSASGSTLADALLAGRDEAAARGRVVIEAKVNGEPIPDAELESPPPGDLADAVVSFLTADPRALVREAMLQVAETLAALTQQQSQAAAAFQRGAFEDAFGLLSDVVSTWDAVRRAVTQGPALLGLEATGLTVRGPAGDEPLARHAERLSLDLTRLREALAAQDWSTLADVLEGELADQVAAWEGIARVLANDLGRSADAGSPGGGRDVGGGGEP